MKADNDSAERLRVPTWYWLLIPAVMLLFQSWFTAVGVAQLPYSEFKQLLYAGKVSDVTVAEQIISGTLKPAGLEQVLSKETLDRIKCVQDRPCRFSTARVADPSLVQDMEASGVRFVGQPANTLLSTLLSWVLPFLLLFWLAGAMAKRSGMGSGLLLDIGKSRARVYVASNTGVTFNDVAGIDEAKDELMEVVAFLKNPERYRRLGGRIPKGVLIVGAPGTGKTLLAKAVAGEAGVPFFSISGSEFVEMFVGVGAARVRDLFTQAQEKAPCIIFIDELDALGRARGVAGIAGGGYNEQEQTLNQLLVEMDGFDTNKGVIILAATNRPEILDPALLRPGRFDRHIALDRPDLKGREKILAVHARQVKLAPQVDLAAIAARTAGFAGADLANLINEAALLAGRLGKDQVGVDDIDEAIDRIVAGLKKTTRVMNRQRKGNGGLPRGRPCAGGRVPPRRRPRGEGVDHPARHRRARLHAAAAHRRPLPAQEDRAARPARRLPRRPRGRGAGVRRRLDRRAKRPAAGHRHGAPHGHAVRDERAAGPCHLRSGARLRWSIRRARRSATNTANAPRARSTRKSPGCSTRRTCACATRWRRSGRCSMRWRRRCWRGKRWTGPRSTRSSRRMMPRARCCRCRSSPAPDAGTRRRRGDRT